MSEIIEAAMKEIQAHPGAWCFMFTGEDGNSWTRGSTAPDEVCKEISRLSARVKELEEEAQHVVTNYLSENSSGSAVEYYVYRLRALLTEKSATRRGNRCWT